jgi:UDP:flavonoid glycosyltransferase YjiC (YdhE family)
MVGNKMKVLLAASPVVGHANPIIAVGRILKKAGHDVSVYTSRFFQAKVESAGLRFCPLPEDVDHDLRDIDAAFPERSQYEPGVPRRAYDTKRIFIDAMVPQFKGLEAILQHFPAEVVLYETTFFGVLPFLLAKGASRPATVCLNITTLLLPREDGAPFGPGLPFTVNFAERERYSALSQQIYVVLHNPLREYANNILHPLGVESLSASVLETMLIRADLLIQPCVAGFEYPLRDPLKALHFIGALLPDGEGDFPPEVREAKEAGRKIVLVTQGTLANTDFGQLLAPAIQALAKRDDVLVLATTGGRPIDCIPGSLGPNTLASKFLNFNAVLPYVDLLIAFGGYGTVTHALTFGVPMVLAGLSEDKPEVAARAVWTGCGINLPTENPTVEQLAEAVQQVLANPSYRNRAAELSLEFAAHNPTKELLQLIEGLVVNRQTALH